MDTINETFSQMTGQAMSAMNNYTKIWTEMMNNLATAGMSFSPGATPTDAMRQIRGNIFRTMADAMEDTMRTPQFLEMMRQSMDAMLTMRKQVDGVLNMMHHSLQNTTSEDIDTLMVTIRHMERRILDRMEDLSERIDDIEEWMDRADGDGGEHSRRTARRSSGRRQSTRRME